MFWRRRHGTRGDIAKRSPDLAKNMSRIGRS